MSLYISSGPVTEISPQRLLFSSKISMCSYPELEEAGWPGSVPVSRFFQTESRYVLSPNTNKFLMCKTHQ